jgi:hypothetical protein
VQNRTADLLITKQNQKLALGELAFECGLHLFDLKSLSIQFEQIAKTFGVFMQDKITKKKQIIPRLEQQDALTQLKKRKADTRRKIEYGGLVIKSGMHAYTKNIVLGALIYVEQLIANDFDYASFFQNEGKHQFLNFTEI